MAGAIAKKLLMESLGVEVIAHTQEIGGVKSPRVNVNEIKSNAEGNNVRCGNSEAAEKMAARIREVASDGDSVGGVVECIVMNLPAGVGEPVIGTLEGELAMALYSIPGVKAVEFGLGRDFSSSRGSESNDAYLIRDGKIITETNNAGGILGGISTGMPIICKVTFKPTPSIGKRQKSVNLSTMEETTIEIKGRHDPCIVPRAVPVVEGMVAVVLADQAIRAGLISNVMGKRR
jgi:chorismate synthase